MRAERLAAAPAPDAPGGVPFDGEGGRRGGVRVRPARRPRPAATGPAGAQAGIELALDQAGGGAPTELFDFERAA